MGKWKEVKVQDIAKNIQYGYTGKTVKKGNYKYLRITDIQNHKVDWNSVPISDISSEKEIKKYSLKVNDILFARTGATVGKSFLIEDREPSVFASYLIRVQPKDIVSPRFLYLYFQSESYWKQIRGHEVGAAQPNVNGKKLGLIKFPLPPLPEQKRIVAKLDGLFEKIEQAIGLLEENIAHTEALMGSVLDEEFGKLDCKSFALKDISEKIQYGYTGKTKNKGKYYYLRITDIQDSQVNYNKTPFSNIPDDKVSKYILNKGDILFARTGATAGKSYLYNDDEQSVFASYLIRVVVNQDSLSPFYLKWYFQSDDYWNQIFENIVGSAQPNFNGKKLGELIIPVPNLEIQKSCVSKFEKYDEVIRASKATQTQKLNHLKALKNSLLDQAFKGELLLDN